MGSRQIEPHRAPEADRTDTATRDRNATLQRQPHTKTTEPTPDSDQSAITDSQTERQYDVDITSRRQLNELQRLEKTHGDKIHDWIAEGIPREAMGTPSEMHAFRNEKDSAAAATDTTPAGESDVPESVRDVISSSGQPLDGPLQRTMEHELGGSFDDVQVHTGSTAATACEDINARAFTVGNHVAFNRGEYDPRSPEGQHVIAHELAHVKQQTGGAVSLLPQEERDLEIDPDPQLEREAETTARRVMQGDEGGIQRLENTGVHIQRTGQTAPQPATIQDDPLFYQWARKLLLRGYNITEPDGTKRRIPGGRRQQGNSCHYESLQAYLAAKGYNTTPMATALDKYPQVHDPTRNEVPTALQTRITDEAYSVDDIVDLEADPEAQQYVRGVLSSVSRNDIASHYKILGEIKAKVNASVQNPTPKHQQEYNSGVYLLNNLQYVSQYAINRGIPKSHHSHSHWTQPKELTALLLDQYKDTKKKYGNRSLSTAEQHGDADLKAGATLLKNNLLNHQNVGDRSYFTPDDDEDRIRTQLIKKITQTQTPFLIGASGDLLPAFGYKHSMSNGHTMLGINIRNENNSLMLDFRDSNMSNGGTESTSLDKLVSSLSQIYSRSQNKDDITNSWISISSVELDQETIDGLTTPIDVFEHLSDKPEIIGAATVKLFNIAEEALQTAATKIATINEELGQFRKKSVLKQLYHRPQKAAVKNRLHQAQTEQQQAKDKYQNAKQGAEVTRDFANIDKNSEKKGVERYTQKVTTLESEIKDIESRYEHIKQQLAGAELFASEQTDLFAAMTDGPTADNPAVSQLASQASAIENEHRDRVSALDDAKTMHSLYDGDLSMAQQKVAQADLLLAQIEEHTAQLN